MASVVAAVTLLFAMLASVNGRAFHDAIVVEARSGPPAEESTSFNPEMCYLPRATGPCRGFFPAYYFNPATKRCDTFVYSGCGGNKNRFQSQEECDRKCKQVKKQAEECDEPTPICDEGCKISTTENGCAQCECPPKDPQVVCRLPAVRGHCRAMLPRWRYDADTQKCREFKFGGCGGNGNNFMSRDECQLTCSGIST